MFLGVIAAIAVPNLLKAKETARLKTTKQDIATISTALAGYVTDNGYAPAQPGGAAGIEEIRSALTPFYVKALPSRDAWGNEFLLFCGEACNGWYGLRDCQADDFLVVSLGKGGASETWTYDPNDASAGLFVHSGFEDFEKDLVMFNGSWIRASSR
ncbi:MAG: hypothetical protein A2Y70_05115 [Candidatus Aminicenantes bacterium RBG_13_64_14]|nr:MAG: hypothetical protein A2Y70_05115 [Candidatus Aminicenantes bacterium RBG_13_64_14]